MPMIEKVLVANRGEIARRIFRTCHALGIATVAVFSEADARLPYVAEAGQALCIGPAAPNASYLRGDVIIAAAKETGATAIHPGYGFLSENPEFARQVMAAGLIWIGPTPSSMDALGSKSAAKGLAEAAQVPITPWFAVGDVDDALVRAQTIGYPVMVKPVAGGGGKGMYRCDDDQELSARIERAAREALSAFGDAGLLVEKYLVNPRHIEVQILADNFGNVLHLFERECSIQRRNQKLIEEAPSSCLSEAERSAICADAVRIATAAGYTNAGTCEFLFDAAERKWYFCEMNTRLQVEHPVTEAITGLDLVEQQLRVAAGEPLTLKQPDITRSGHAVEFRIVTEDPFANFTPSLGSITFMELPTGPGIRNEAGYREHDTVAPYYDSMIAKLIVSGASREEAIQRARCALREYWVMGVSTCIPFHLAMLEDEGFLASRFHIHYAETRLQEGLLTRSAAEQAAIFAALCEWRARQRQKTVWRAQRAGGVTPWSYSGLPRA